MACSVRGGWVRSLLAWALCAVLALPAGARAAGEPPAALGTAGTVSVQLWFSNDRLNPDLTDCRAVFAVQRRVPTTRGLAAATLRALFAGPTPDEAAAGFRSVFSEASSDLLKSVHIHNRTAYVDLRDLSPVLSGATSSCGAAEFQAQVARSLKRFPNITRVIYAFDGKPQSFYGWMNESCGPQNGACDPRPFGASR
jgi:hypothetical protein